VPLTWQTPLAGERTGPGYPVVVSSSLIGPIPSTYQWIVSIRSTDGREAVLLHQFWNALSFQQVLNVKLGDLAQPQQPDVGNRVNVPVDGPVRLFVDLVDQSGQRVDGDVRDAKWDPTGQLFILEQAGGTVQGGFTATDRTTIQTTDNATRVEIPTQVTTNPTLSNPLADWLTLSHGTAYVRGDVLLLSGRGELSVHTPRGVAFGFVFSWFTVPLELGRADGLQPVYAQELFQVGIVYADGGLDLYYDQVHGFQTDGHFVEWPNLRWPERIDYWVYPGVTVALQFMVVPS
jgi:hypothetical protein